MIPVSVFSPSLAFRRHASGRIESLTFSPIAGDQFYPRVRRGPDAPEDFAEPLCLLARAIAFDDPVTGQPRHFASRRTLAWPAD